MRFIVKFRGMSDGKKKQYINSRYFLCCLQEPDLIHWDLSGRFLAALSNLIHSHVLQLLSQDYLVLATIR